MFPGMSVKFISRKVLKYSCEIPSMVKSGFVPPLMSMVVLWHGDKLCHYLVDHRIFPSQPRQAQLSAQSTGYACLSGRQIARPQRLAGNSLLAEKLSCVVAGGWHITNIERHFRRNPLETLSVLGGNGVYWIFNSPMMGALRKPLRVRIKTASADVIKT